MNHDIKLTTRPDLDQLKAALQAESRFEELTYYQCKKCRRVWHQEPKQCSCERSLSCEGARVGPFEIIKRISGPGQKLLVRCGFCTVSKEIASSNIRKQHSCGCKPRHIQIIETDPDNQVVTYKCRQCASIQTEHFPPSWCCINE
jgi:hypothetical protein